MQSIEQYNKRCIHNNATIKQTPENTRSNQETNTHVQLPHCLATHLSASDSLRPWRYIKIYLLTYLLT